MVVAQYGHVLRMRVLWDGYCATSCSYRMWHLCNVVIWVPCTYVSSHKENMVRHMPS